MRLKMEKIKKVPFTEDAERIALERLGRYREEGYDIGHVLEESTFKGWAGLFVNEGTPRIKIKAEPCNAEYANKIEERLERARKLGVDVDTLH